MLLPRRVPSVRHSLIVSSSSPGACPHASARRRSDAVSRLRRRQSTISPLHSPGICCAVRSPLIHINGMKLPRNRPCQFLETRAALSTSSSSETAAPPSQATTTSVSSDEVTKFSSLADGWWDSSQNPLIGMNPVRVSYLVDTLRLTGRIPPRLPQQDDGGGADNRRPPLTGLKALDVGCGGGLLSESLARLGAEVTAIDPSADVVSAAREHSRHDPRTACIVYRGGVAVEDLSKEMITQDGTELLDSDSNEKLFDVVCILEVLEHTSDPQSLLNAAVSLLKRPSGPDEAGGLLFVSTVNRTLKSYGIAIIGAEYVTGKVPVGTHSWELFRSPDEVRTMMKCAQLEEVDVSGMVLRPPFVDLGWTLDANDVDVNWIGAYHHKRGDGRERVDDSEQLLRN